MTQELATIPQKQPSTADLIGAVIQTGITPESVSVVERLVALKERETKADAERQFATAFAALQMETPKIQAQKAVPDNAGNIRYKFAPYEDIWRAVRPLLNKHGFAVSYDQDIADTRVVVTCKLTHIGGHSQSNRFQCRIGSGPPKASEAQGDGAATTYAKRFALCAALGISIEQDTDGADPNETVTQQQADSLKSRCIDSNSDIVRFLKFLKVEKFEDILAKDYGKADSALRMKEAQK